MQTIWDHFGVGRSEYYLAEGMQRGLRRAPQQSFIIPGGPRGRVWRCRLQKFPGHTGHGRCPPEWNEYIPKKNRHSESVTLQWPFSGRGVKWGIHAGGGAPKSESSQNSILKAGRSFTAMQMVGSAWNGISGFLIILNRGKQT